MYVDGDLRTRDSGGLRRSAVLNSYDVAKGPQLHLFTPLPLRIVCVWTGQANSSKLRHDLTGLKLGE